MFAKSKRFGLVSLFALAACALGGCAASVGNERPSVPTEAIAYLTPQHVVAPSHVGSSEQPATPVDPRLVAAAPAAPAAAPHRRDDCGR